MKREHIRAQHEGHANSLLCLFQQAEWCHGSLNEGAAVAEITRNVLKRLAQ